MTQIARSSADRLAACTSSVIHDVMRDMQVPVRVLPRTIRGVENGMRAAGPVFTVRGRPNSKLDKETSLFEWAGVLSRCPAGHVVVMQPQDDTRALFGGLSAEALAIKGARGYIVDGGCRDAQSVTDLGFPVFTRFYTPLDIVAGWQAEAFAEPVAIGGLLVTPGDFVIADRDGIVLIDAEALSETLDRAEKKLSAEDAMVQAIRAGEDPQAAYLKHRVF